jgi:hypothetical protein
MSKDVNAKLIACEAALRRWHTRLIRASNMLQKLEKQRRRLMPVRTMADRTAEQKAAGVVPGQGTIVRHDDLAFMPSNQKPDEVTRPAFLDRTDPLIAEKMTAARKKAEAAARSAMPLTGRAALEAIRPKRKAKA